MNDKEEKYQSIIEKIAQTLGKSIEDVRKGYDEIIMTNNVNRDGEELYLLRKIVSEEVLKGIGVYKNKGRYSIYTKEGEFAGFIDATVANYKKANKAEIEYKTIEKQRNKGNITIALEEVLKDIFINHSFDNLTIRDIFPTTNIEEVFLNINSDNYASQAVARKSRFQQNGNIHTMTKERFLEIFSEREIGKNTVNISLENKDKAKDKVRLDEQTLENEQELQSNE